MAERKSLIESIKPPERTLEEQFVRSGKVVTPDAQESPPARESKARSANAVGRAPLTTRVRADFAEALKRASLQRQLDGVTPNTLQEILEEALEPWLRKHGYL